EPLEQWPGAAEPAEREAAVEPWTEPDAPFLLAAWGDPADAHFNGKLEEPRLRGADGRVIAMWILGGDFASDHVEDVSGGGRHGRCVNLPMRAVTGRSWRGGTPGAAPGPDGDPALWCHGHDFQDPRE